MPGRHATTEGPASTGWRAMSVAVRASSPESTANFANCRPSSLYAWVPELGYAYPRGYTKPIPGGTPSQVVLSQKQCPQLKH